MSGRRSEALRGYDVAGPDELCELSEVSDVRRAFGNLVARNGVHRSVYISPDVFFAERERIFGQSWLYAGHESQVPSAGDYFCTELAGR